MNRDLDIMLGLARNGFMTTNQIEKKWFTSYWSCIKRLKKLKDNKYLKVDYIERYSSGIYSLTKQGLDFINDYYGYDYKNYSRSNKINHFTSCSEFYINFPHPILEYKMEYDLKNIIPDIYVKYNNPYKNKKVDLLVEIDNTNRKGIIKSKIKTYNKFFLSGVWQDFFTKFPKCFVVTNNKSVNVSNSTIPFVIISFDDLKTNKLKQLLK